VLVKRKALALTFISSLLASALAGTELVSLVSANPVPPTTQIEIQSPQYNETCLVNSVFLNFTVFTHPNQWTQCIGTPSIQCYVDGKLYHQINLTELTDCQANVSFSKFSISLKELNVGQHNVVVTKTAFYHLMVTAYLDNTPSKLVYFYVYSPPPRISPVSPQNQTYENADIPVNFTAHADYGEVAWMGYSLDGKNNMTITGNTTLTELAVGSHNITFYATDIYGSVGASETITFGVAEPFPTAIVAAASASVAIVGVGLLVYFKKRKS